MLYWSVLGVYTNVLNIKLNISWCLFEVTIWILKMAIQGNSQLILRIIIQCLQVLIGNHNKYKLHCRQVDNFQ